MQTLEIVECGSTEEALYDWALRLEIKGDGALAAKRGSTRYTNPHADGSKQANWWLEGFDNPSSVYCTRL